VSTFDFLSPTTFFRRAYELTKAGKLDRQPPSFSCGQSRPFSFFFPVFRSARASKFLFSSTVELRIKRRAFYFLLPEVKEEGISFSSSARKERGLFPFFSGVDGRDEAPSRLAFFPDERLLVVLRADC